MISRKFKILRAATRLATVNDLGYIGITRDEVAKKANCSTGLVNKYYSTVDDLRGAVIEHAVKVQCLKIIAQAHIMGDCRLTAPSELINTALESFLI